MASRPGSGRERCLSSRGETQRHTYQVAINNCSQRAAFSVMTLTFCSFLSVLRVPVWVSDSQFAGTRTDPIFSPHILGNQSDKGIKKMQNRSSSAVVESEGDRTEAKLQARRLLQGQSLSRFRSRLTQPPNITASHLPTASAIPQAKLFFSCLHYCLQWRGRCYHARVHLSKWSCFSGST